jgi:RND superfamily putative drug exporter
MAANAVPDPATGPGQAPPALGVLYAVGLWCARHAVLVVLAWLVALGAVLGLNRAFGGTYSDDFTLPGTASQTGVEVLRAHDPVAGGYGAQVVLHTAKGTIADKSSQVDQAVSAISRLPHVLTAVNPLNPPPGAVSEDGRTAYISVRFGEPPSTLGSGYLDGVDSAVAPLREAGVQVEYGGPLGELSRPKGQDLTSEAIGFAVAIVVLLVGFGSVAGAVTPLVTALVAVLMGLACLDRKSVV